MFEFIILVCSIIFFLPIVFLGLLSFLLSRSTYKVEKGILNSLVERLKEQAHTQKTRKDKKVDKKRNEEKRQEYEDAEYRDAD